MNVCFRPIADIEFTSAEGSVTGRACSGYGRLIAIDRRGRSAINLRKRRFISNMGFGCRRAISARIARLVTLSDCGIASSARVTRKRSPELDFKKASVSEI